MTAPNPFATPPAPPAPAPSPFSAPVPSPDPAGVITPPPVSVAVTQNPATIDPAYQAWLTAQQAAAPPVPAAPPMDPAYAAWLASQQQTAPVPPAQSAAPVATFSAPPAAPPTYAPNGSDPFDDPAPPKPKGPRMQELYNRLVIVIPKVMERVASNDENKPAGTMVDKMTCDVIVLDGGPLHYGGRPEAMPPVPHDKVAQLPYREMGMAVWSFGIISACREAYAKRQQGLPGMIIGRVTVGEQKDVRKSAPWLIRKATDEEKAIGRQYLATVAQDVFA